ncbi:uncharacterized protein LOC123321121 [Coccinella septempunctata]|uniref:uncharacterized protein LOC123321121 n=1 Tax=Coccinella septempunctata TaxID=41139 RepID=UPI001D08AFC9|nr:uncharacterized protein LOC123321121 [Coccinella septempunctata]
MKIFIVLICLNILSSAVCLDIYRGQIVDECAEKNGLSDDDLEKWISYQKSTEDKFLCFMLCCHQKDGSLNEDGKWNQQFLEKHLNEMYLINNTLKSQIMQCFSDIPPIQSCQDMRSVEHCIPEIKIRNCRDEFGISNEDVDSFAKNPSDPSDKMLCYLKCSSENDNLIFEDGSLNHNFLRELIERSVDMGDQEKHLVEDCLSKIPPVRSCSDFKPFARCVVKMNLF